METNDLGSKKIDNAQALNEGFSGENISDYYDPSQSKMKSEKETDQNGNSKIVERARNIDGNLKNEGIEGERNWNENESLSRGVSNDEELKKTIENKDHNSDIATNRYPNSHPDNHEDRGNIKLDE